MSLIDKKNECNLKYCQLLELLKQGGSLNNIHKLIVGIAENLLEIGRMSPYEYEKCNKKAKALLDIAKGITFSTSRADIYFKLTGENLSSTQPAMSELESVIRDLENLERIDPKKSESGSPKPPENNPQQGDKKDEWKNDHISIRPMSLDDYIGQTKVKLQLKEAIEAAKLKKRPLEHILFFGSAGLGKTSLAKIVSNEMNSRIIIMSGPTIKDPLTFVTAIKDVEYGDIVFIDEIHRINPLAAEAIYTVMEDFELSYLERTKDGSRNVHLKLPPFTIIGATTHSGLLEKPMLDRFPIQFKLEMYSEEELSLIALSTMQKLGKRMASDAALEIAKRSRGVARICNSYVKRIFDRALVRKVEEIDADFVREYFDNNGIDENGLLDIDIKYLKTLYERFGTRPAGIESIASTLGEGRNILESQVEPYLLYLGFIQITPGGRMITQVGIDYITKSGGPGGSADVLTEAISDSESDSNFKLTAEYLIDSSNRDDDYALAASMMYSNIEENLIYAFRLPHRDRKFVIDYDEYLKIADTAEADGSYILKRYGEDGSLQPFLPNVVEHGEDGNPKLVEMPPVVRFLKAGLSAREAKRAADYWQVINRIRHRSPENESYLESYFSQNSLTKRDFLLSALRFFKENNLYTKD